ncbi:MAG TPA: hypothetical protein VJZ00_04330 [Thermoanaerobaculia bacterium]|nr:hypothetical protein [Thermoanaerobaculia bacterium]
MWFLAPADLRAIALQELLDRRDCVVAYGEGEVRGAAAANLLFADYAVLRRDATLIVETPEAWAAVAWRLGRGALRWQVRGARADEIVDEITDAEPAAWREEWMRGRSVMALDSAAALIRMRGGDALERAEFARLFAIGEPQKGLGAFLAKVPPSYSLNPERTDEPQRS